MVLFFLDSPTYVNNKRNIINLQHIVKTQCSDSHRFQVGTTLQSSLPDTSIEGSMQVNSASIKYFIIYSIRIIYQPEFTRKHDGYSYNNSIIMD